MRCYRFSCTHLVPATPPMCIPHGLHTLFTRSPCVSDCRCPFLGFWSTLFWLLTRGQHLPTLIAVTVFPAVTPVLLSLVHLCLRLLIWSARDLTGCVCMCVCECRPHSRCSSAALEALSPPPQPRRCALSFRNDIYVFLWFQR